MKPQHLYAILGSLIFVLMGNVYYTPTLRANDCTESSCPVIKSNDYSCCPSYSGNNCCSFVGKKKSRKRDCCYDVMCKTHFTPRSQGLDTARWLVGKNSVVRFYQTDQIYGDFSITAEFSRSFRRDRIGKYFTPALSTTDQTQQTCNTTTTNNSCDTCCSTCGSLYCTCEQKNNVQSNYTTTNNNNGSYCSDININDSSCCSCDSCPTVCSTDCSRAGCDCNCFTIGGDRNELDLPEEGRVIVRAEDFGYNGTATICMCPRVSNVIIDFNLYAGLTEYLDGLFVELHAPIVHSWWENEVSICTNETCKPDTFATCLMSTDQNNNHVGTTSVEKALEGNFRWGDVKNRLRYGRIAAGRISKTRLADLRMAVGYDVYSSDRYRFAPKLVVAAPTGNVPTGEYMFEPIVGNSGHWELGGGLSAHAIGYESDHNQVGIFLEGYAAHMFKSRCQQRTFDLLKNGCFSRYLLLKQFVDNGEELDGLERGPNVLTQSVRTRIDVQGDVSAMLSWKHNSWSVDLGYNFWGRSREKVKEFCCCIPENRYGIKGTAPMCDTDKPCTKDNKDFRDTTTASLSTIGESGGNDEKNGIYDEDCEPVFINCADIDLCSALHPSALSHAVFFHFSNTWRNEGDTLQPFFGIGGKVEFSGRGNRALEQWSVWAKGGVAF